MLWALAAVASGGLVAIETAASWFWLDHRLTDVVMIYVLGVALVAARFGRLGSLWTSVLSVTAFDFFFVPPYFSLRVEDTRFAWTLVVLLVVGFVVADMTGRLRRAAAQARDREREAGRLYALSRELSANRGLQRIVAVAEHHLREAFGCEVVALLFQDEESLERVEFSARATGERVLALRGSTGIQGVLVVPPPSAGRFLRRSDRDSLEAFASQIAVTVERCRLAADAEQAQVDGQREHLKNALLSSVSRELRSPLVAIKGAVRTLLEEEPAAFSERFRALVTAVSSEASRLERLVRNLLDMTSLEAGALAVRKEWQPLEEVVGVALARLDEQLVHSSVEIEIAADASFVAFDAVLLEHVLVNLVENAVRHAGPTAHIEIRARSVEDGVELEVADDGPGVQVGQEEAIFEKFFRSRGARGEGSVGLGLTVCRGIVAAHGGRIWASSGRVRGASFRLTLPRGRDLPKMRALPETTGQS